MREPQTPSIPPPKGEGGRRRRPGGGLILQRRVYCLEDTDQIPIDLVIPKSQHAKSVAHEMPVALAIARGVIIEIVLTAIDFDHQLMLQANKIDDEAVAR